MSLFRHNSHRLLTCVSCHAADGSSKTSDVLMPSIAVCQQCHSAKLPASKAARSDCVECHAYHDHALDRKFDGPLLLEGLSRLKTETTTTPPDLLVPAPAAASP